jgi:predicted RNase H-like HicB family nuclease
MDFKVIFKDSFSLSGFCVYHESMNREFFVVIEKDEDGFFVGEVPQLKACYSQGKTIDELLENMKEAIALALEEQGGEVEPTEFVGVQKLLLNV